MRESNRFSTSVHYNATFSGIYEHFDNYMPTDYKFDLISTILFRSFTIGSSMRVNFNWKFLKSRTFSIKTLINAKKILNRSLKKVTIVLLNMGSISLEMKTKFYFRPTFQAWSIILLYFRVGRTWWEVG